MDLKQKVNDLNQMIQSGKTLEAFEKYYHQDLVMQENNEQPRVGKQANREYEEQFVQMVEEWHKADVKSIAIGDGLTMVEWDMEMTLKEMGRVKRNQVSVQQWKDGQIISERFYYGE